MYIVKHKPNQIRSNRAVVRKAVVVRPTSKSGRAPQPTIIKPVRRTNQTSITREIVAAKQEALKLHRPPKSSVTVRVNNPPPILPVSRSRSNGRPVVVAGGHGGVKPGRQPRERLTRAGRADIRHTIRSAQHQKVLREHVNKIKEMHNTGGGKVLVMFACGPSINEVDFTPILGHQYINTMCINKPLTKVWPSTYWSFCDVSQYTRNKESWDTYNGIIWNSPSIRVPHSKQIMVRNRSGQGFSRNLADGYFISRSTTYASMQVALWMGYTTFIFGCDMGVVDGKLHFYGKNPDVDDENRIKRFKLEAEAYNFAAANLTAQERSKFYFCSSYNKFPFVHKFNYMDHKTAVPFILDYANSLGKI